MKDGKNAKKTKNLSVATQKRIDDLPNHAQEIFKEAHSNAVDEYQDPDKRREGKKQSAEEVAHKVAWSAVKKKYKKNEDGTWTKKK